MGGGSSLPIMKLNEPTHQKGNIQKPVKEAKRKQTRIDQLNKLDAVDSHVHKNLSESAYQQFEEAREKIRDTKKNIADIAYEEYEYPFENLVFEGGGAKGQVYVGCVKVSISY